MNESVVDVESDVMRLNQKEVLNSKPIPWDPKNPQIKTLYEFGKDPLVIKSTAEKKKPNPHYRSSATRAFESARLIAVSINGFVFRGRKKDSRKNNKYVFVLPPDFSSI